MNSGHSRSTSWMIGWRVTAGTGRPGSTTSRGTLLTVTHTFDDKGRGARDAAGWHICFASLEARLDGRTRQPFTTERHETLFAYYAQRFGSAAAALKSPDM